MMKKCKTCKTDFDEKYVNCSPCRKKHSEYMKGYYNNLEGNRKRTHKIKIPKSYTKQCVACNDTFTTEPIRGSHCFKYCSPDCASGVKNARKGDSRKRWGKSERGRNYKKAYYHRNRKLKGPQELVCITCKTSFTSRRNEKGNGGDAKYCNIQCTPRKVKAKQLREKKRREGKYCQWCETYICFKDIFA